MKELYAHSTNSQGQRHKLDDHLNKVAILAKKFADKFGAGELAYWVGLWHDVGKFRPAFLIAGHHGVVIYPGIFGGTFVQ